MEDSFQDEQRRTKRPSISLCHGEQEFRATIRLSFRSLPWWRSPARALWFFGVGKEFAVRWQEKTECGRPYDGLNFPSADTLPRTFASEITYTIKINNSGSIGCR